MRRLSLRHQQYVWAYLFLAIPIIFFLGIRIGPTLFAMGMSFYTWNPLAPTQTFIGFTNYEQIWAEFFKARSPLRQAFINTFSYVAIGVPIQLLLGLTVALLLNRVTRFSSFFRAIYFIPFVTSSVAIAWVWRWLYQPQFGLFNLILAAFSLPQQGFLKSPQQALASITAAAVWQGIGFLIIIFLAGLKQIPRIYYEAAAIDGANTWQRLRFITLPLLNPTLVYLAVLQTINFLNMFDHVVNMTEQASGGPLNSTTSIVLRIYREAFGSLNMGFASALTVVFFLIILVISVLQIRFFSRQFEY